MSVQATRHVWSLDLTKFNKRSTKKLVLLALADRANEKGECFPSVSRISEDTCLDRKTVMNTITDLISENLITDTGEKKGKTGQVRVLKINIENATSTKSNTAKQCQISDQAVPNLPSNSTKYPSKQYQKWDTESKIESIKESKKEKGIGLYEKKKEQERFSSSHVAVDKPLSFWDRQRLLEPVGHAAAESPEMKSSFDEQGKDRDGVTKIPESLLAMMKNKMKRSSDKDSHLTQDSNFKGSGVIDTNIPPKSKHTFSSPKQRLGDKRESGMLTSCDNQCDNTHMVNNFNIGDLFKRTTPSPNYM